MQLNINRQGLVGEKKGCNGSGRDELTEEQLQLRKQYLYIPHGILSPVMAMGHWHACLCTRSCRSMKPWCFKNTYLKPLSYCSDVVDRVEPATIRSILANADVFSPHLSCFVLCLRAHLADLLKPRPQAPFRQLSWILNRLQLWPDRKAQYL